MTDKMDVDVKHPYELELVAELDGHTERAWNIAWNPSAPLLASCSADKTVRMWAYKPATGDSAAKSPDESTLSNYAFTALAPIPSAHTKSVRALAWAPSGRTLATASFDSNVGIWEREDDPDTPNYGTGEWELSTLLEGHETECKSVAYSATGTLLASCSRDKSVWVWEVQPDADFECLGVLMEHTQDVKCVAWHPQEEVLASASYDNTVKLYRDDPEDDWYCSHTLAGHSSTVWSVAWHPAGDVIVSGGDGGEVRIWVRRKEGPNESWTCAQTLKDHTRTVYSVSWSRDGKMLASTSGDGAVWVYAFDNGEVLPTPIAHLVDAHGVYDVNAISFCPRVEGEGLVATAGDDGVVRVWRVRKTS